MVAKCQDENIPALPIVGNGDVFSWRDYAEKRELAPATCDCAMLARGALIKPWLPTELKENATGTSLRLRDLIFCATSANLG